MVSSLPVSSLSPPPKELAIGMDFNSSPPISITPTNFGFLKSLDLKSVGMSLEDVPSIMGWELVVYNPVVAESRSMRTESVGSSNMGVENILEEPFLNDDSIGDIEDIDSDDSNSILLFKQTTWTIP